MRRLRDVPIATSRNLDGAAMPASANGGPGPEPAEALRLRRAVKARGLALDVARHANGKSTYTVREPAARKVICIVSTLTADEVDEVEMLLDRIADASPGAIDAARARLAEAEAEAERLLAAFDAAEKGKAQLAAFKEFDAACRRRSQAGAELSMMTMRERTERA